MILSRRVQVAAAVVFGFGALASDAGEATAKATLTIGGEKVVAEHVLVEEGMGEQLVVLVSDRELEAPCSAITAMTVAGEVPFSGVTFAIEEDLTMAAVPQGIFHPSLDPMDGWMSLDGEITAERTGSMISGSMKGVASVAEAEIPVEVIFDVPVTPEPAPIAARKVEGDDSEPAKAFSAMTAAVVSGDLDGFLAGVASEMREMIVADDPSPELLRDVADFMLPHRVAISGTKIEGDSAILTARGETTHCGATEESEMTIEMRREDGRWRVVTVDSSM